MLRVYSFRLSRWFESMNEFAFVEFALPEPSVYLFCVKVLRQSLPSGVYLSNCLSECIHIWPILTLEGGIHSMTPKPRVHAPGCG